MQKFCRTHRPGNLKQQKSRYSAKSALVVGLTEERLSNPFEDIENQMFPENNNNEEIENTIFTPPRRPPRQTKSGILRKQRQAKVIDEILCSEKAYLDHLSLLIRHFMDPLSVCGIVSDSELKILFGETRSIRLVNQVLYDHLSHGDVIGAFATLTPFLKLYSSYARNFPSSQHLLQELHQRKGFSVFLRKQEDLQEVGGLKLPALLIMPIQRIPRYNLLLKELRGCTSDSSDLAQLDEVLSQLHEVTEFVDDCVKGPVKNHVDYDNCIRILTIQKKLDSCAPKLLIPGRKLIKEGMLKKVSRHGKHKLVQRMVWLFNDVVIYGKAHPRKKDHFLCSCVLPLRHCYTERLIGKNVFKISCKGEILYLAADNYATIDDWINALESAITELRETRLTLRKESSCSTPQRRKILNSAKRRTSSLSQKIRRKHRTNYKREGKNEETNCDRWFDGFLNLVTPRKRKRVDTPVKGTKFSKKRNSLVPSSTPNSSGYERDFLDKSVNLN